MKTKINNLIILQVLISLTISFIVFPSEIILSVNSAIKVWKDNLLPVAFPFFLISELLINYGFIELFSELSKNVMGYFFHLKGECSFVIIGSILSGFPSSSKYINTLLENNQITIKDATYLLKFNHFPNPLFVIATIGTILLKNKKLGTIILYSIIISNFIIALIFRPKQYKYKHEKISIKKAITDMNKKRTNNHSSFSELLANAIINSFNTLILLLGIIISFFILTSILKKVFNLPVTIFSLISGILEMTQGINNISLLNLSLKVKAIIITFLISFGGLSIHMQVMSILSKTQIKYIPYLISRILHAVISSVITYILFIFL